MIGGTIWGVASALKPIPGVLDCNGLTRDRYQKAFVDFFEDELVRFSYDWKQVVAEYLFTGEQPVFNAIMADCMSTPSTPAVQSS